MGKVELKIEIDADLAAQAEAFGVSASKVAAEAIQAAVARADTAGAEARAKAWAEENAEAIADYNRRIRERGLFSDGIRTW